MSSAILVAKEETKDEENEKSLGNVDVINIEDDVEKKEQTETPQGANIVVEDSHRNTAIDFFENYFARAYKKRDDAPMNEKRFLRSIDRVKKRENLDDAYI